MSMTQQVNFRADSSYYQKAKNTLEEEKVTISDILNATLRKIATGAINPSEFVSNDSVVDDSLRTAFADLQNEILIGHQAILAGKTSSLADVRKEFNL